MFSLSGKPLRLSSKSTVSSTTPGIVENSCSTVSDLDVRYRSAGNRGEQHAAKRVAQRDAESAIERLDHELGIVLATLANFDLRALRRIQNGHSVVVDPCYRLRYPQRAAFTLRSTIVRLAGDWSERLARVVLDDELFVDRRVDLLATREGQHLRRRVGFGEGRAIRDGGEPSRLRSVTLNASVSFERSADRDGRRRPSR